MGSFCTSIHCMDGRIQEFILAYMKACYGTDYVDTVTEPGPCRILAENADRTTVDGILRRVRISVDKHGSRVIAISGHHDCTGNPCDEATQKAQVAKAIAFCRGHFPDPGILISGLWLDEAWRVHPI